MFAGVGTGEWVEEDGDIGGEGGDPALFELDFDAGLESLVELHILHAFVDTILLTSGFLLAPLPPELYITG